MKRAILIGILLAVAAGAAYFFFFAGKEKTVSVLVFSRTKGFRHESIAAGKKALIEMGKQNGFRVDTTEDAGMFKETYLRHYNVVVFLNTTGDVLNPSQQLVFNRFIQGGGGFVGIHSAADTEYDWEWYGNLVGAYFKGHPNNPNVRQATVRIVDKKHPATKNLPSEWPRSDEWYNYKDIKSHIHVLAEVDESTYEGGENGPHHPISWYHEFDGGRSFYTGLGHTAESFSEKAFLEMLHGGIEYAAGSGQLVDFGKASAAPEETRFSKVVLQENLNEPMELAMLPDRSILFVERKGQLRMFSPGADSARTIAKLNVHTGHEDGLLGIAIDPAYAQNHWIYLFYSPAGDVPKQHISRFVLENGKLDLASEKILLEIPTQREECCHSAGSMEWGPGGLLYISLGDNTNPHGASGFAPLDEQEGRSSWDAQRSAGNTMDLRGKILRIKPEADGTYSIPEGNLFPKDGKSGRPEIYIMGCRNPFRISVDAHTGFLYWGEVGPDAGEDSTHRGPKGHDEVNQARAAGNFGWPYFVGDNKAYKDFDFVKGKSGEAFNPENPLNQSINNTGSQQLPPANKAFIWYPYSPSPEFPQVGDGSRNAMAGPVFYATDYPESGSRFPEYYDGKLFIYDWVRGWIMAVTMDDEGNYLHMERFMPGNTFSNPMDMLWGPDGDLYMLEYGTKWFSQNTDARLVHITYTAGNRPPKAALAASKTVGAVPLVVQADASQTVDYDKDSLQYEWLINGKPADAQGISPTFTFSQPGEYTLTLIAKDPQGLSSRQDL
ncbi:MAG: cytochrome C, partial [Bacteroidetes bacterium]